MPDCRSAWVAAAALALFAPALPARPPYVAMIPNGNVNLCANCHTDVSGGGARNPFGESFGRAGRNWSAALAGEDSDGDGVSNGAELQDPAGAWGRSPQPVGDVRFVSSPGFNFSTPGERTLRFSGLLLEPSSAQGEHQAIQIVNTGTDPVDTSGLWLVSNGGAWQIAGPGATVAPGGTLVVFLNADGRDVSASQVVEPSSGGLPPLDTARGSLSIHWVSDPQMQFSRQQSMIDYVEWGAGGQAREETAVRANLWTAGGFVPAPSMGQLLRRTGAGQGAPNWSIPGGN